MAGSRGRFPAGNVILAVGCLVFLIVLIAGNTHGPTPPAPHTKHPADAIPGASAALSNPVGLPALPNAVALPGPISPDEPPEEGIYHPLNSRSIRGWKDLPVTLVHLPHWLSKAEHRKVENGTQYDAQLDDFQFRLKLLGFDDESVQRGLAMVKGIDKALLDAAPGSDPVARLLAMAKGGEEAAEFAAQLALDGGSEAVQVRALALLAERASDDRVGPAVRALAFDGATPSVRASAAISLLFMKRAEDASAWIAAEKSAEAATAFLEASRAARQVLDPNRPPNVLVFRSLPAIESPAIVDTLMRPDVAARWPAMTLSSLYSTVSWFGRDRADVGEWLAGEYARATTDFMRASILFAGLHLAHPGVLEDRAIEIARAAEPGLLARTALASLGWFETEKSFRTLVEVIPRLEGNLAEHALFAIVRLQEWRRAEIKTFLELMAETHRDAAFRTKARAALDRDFMK